MFFDVRDSSLLHFTLYLRYIYKYKHILCKSKKCEFYINRDFFLFSITIVDIENQTFNFKGGSLFEFIDCITFFSSKVVGV